MEEASLYKYQQAYAFWAYTTWLESISIAIQCQRT